MAASGTAQVKPLGFWKRLWVAIAWVWRWTGGLLYRAFARFVWPWLRRLLRALVAPFVWWWQQFLASFARGIAIFIAAVTVVFFGSAILLRVAAPKPELIVSAFEITDPTAKGLGIDGKSLTNIFADQLESIIEGANSFFGEAHSHKAYRRLPDSPHIPVQTTYGIAIEGISLDQVVAVWHRVRYKQYLLSGDLLVGTGNHSIIYVRYQRDEEAQSFESRIENPTADSIRGAFHELAVRMLSTLEPAIAIRHILKQGLSCSGRCAQENFENAVILAREWVKNAPGNPQALFYLGYALNELSQPEQALLAFKKAIELDDRFDLAYNSMGVSLLALGCWKESEDRFNIALRIRKSPYPWANLAAAEYHQGHFELAAEYCRRSIAVDPIAYSYKGLGFALLHMRNYGDAEKAFRNARRFDPADLDSLEGLAIALSRSGKPDLALDEINYTALFLTPDVWQSFWIKGIIALEQHKPDAALEEFNNAIQRHPTAKVWVEIARAQRMKKEAGQATLALRNALNLDLEDKSEQARAHHLLGVVLGESGNVTEGQKELDFAKKLNPAGVVDFPMDCDPSCNGEAVTGSDQRRCLSTMPH